LLTVIRTSIKMGTMEYVSSCAIVKFKKDTNKHTV